MGDSHLVLRVLGLGAISGLRSMAAPAALSRAMERGDVDGLGDTPFAALGSSRVSTALRVMEIGELIADKLPVAPSRTSPLPVLGRAVIGAFVGAALFASRGRRTATGGVLGAVSALTGAYAGERLRMKITQDLGVPNVVAGLLEDGIALLGASRLLR